MFRVLKSFPCDIFLGSHGSYFDLEAKYRRRSAGAQANPFVDPDGYRQFVQGKEQEFRDELDRQRAQAKRSDAR